MGEIKKVIVADDEAIQRNVLAKLVGQLLPDVKVITCCNGKEVLSAMETVPVQLVLTDIRMPEMDGMELIAELSNRYPETKLVLISAYQEFEYAQKAIRCQVMDYLIKPFRKKDVEQLLRQAEEELTATFAKNTALSQEYEQKKQMLRRMLTGTLQDLDYQQLNSFETFGVVAAIEWGYGSKDLYQNKEEKNKEQETDQIQKQLLYWFPRAQFVYGAISDQYVTHRCYVLIPQKTVSDTQRLFEEFRNVLMKEKIWVWVGVSSICGCLLTEAKPASVQAEEALAYRFYEEQGCVFIFDDIKDRLTISLPSSQTLEKELKQAVVKGDYHQLCSVLEEFQNLFGQNDGYYPSKIKHRMMTVTMSLIKEIEGVIQQPVYEKLLDQVYQRYLQCNSFKRLFEMTRQVLFQVIELYVNVVENFDAVNACIRYIEEHLGEELSLVSVAEHLHFHPNYLSSMLKRKVGLTYSGFLNNIRMKHAKAMLIDTDEKIQTIAAECGFRDTSYFNRVFKREFDLSPEQYRRLHHHDKENN